MVAEKTLFPLILILGLFLFDACGVRVEEGEKMSEVLFEMGENDRFIRLEFSSAREFDPSPELQQFQIIDHVLQDSVLSLTVQYGGGCKEHPFYAIFIEEDGATKIYLQDPETTDYCRALITEKVKIYVGELIRMKAGESVRVNDYKQKIQL